MALTVAEEKRIIAIEEMLNLVQVAINNTVAKQEVRQTLLIKQKEIDALTQRVASLEAQITVLQDNIG